MRMRKREKGGESERQRYGKSGGRGKERERERGGGNSRVAMTSQRADAKVCAGSLLNKIHRLECGTTDFRTPSIVSHPCQKSMNKG